MNPFNFEDAAWICDNIDEAMFGFRPRGTKRVWTDNLKVNDPKTIEELAYSELLGKDVKILKK